MPAVFHGSEHYTTGEGPGPVLTIGNFDGVHLGHAALVGRTVERARATGTRAVAYTFDPAPRDVLRPDNGIGRIQSLDDRVARLGDLGIDEVVVETFTLAFGANGPEWFAREVLERRLGVSGVVVGWDFRFGRGRSGTFEGLQGLLSVPVEQVAAQSLDGEIVSSSRIREALHAGEVEVATRLLGREHDVAGIVGPGDGRGRQIGFPTANVVVDGGMLPAPGVYAVRAQLGGVWRPAVANLGTRPTFAGQDERLEVHVLDHSGDLYGSHMRVAFVGRLRGEVAFDGIEALTAQIRRDVARARELL